MHVRSYIQDTSVAFASTLGLKELPRHAETFVLSFLLFLFVHQVFAPVVSRRWFPTTFGNAGKRLRNNWSIHIVSQVHTFIIIPLAALCLDIHSLDHDRAYGWDERVGVVFAVACGYFLWDSLDAIINFTDIGFVIHGIACLTIYALSFTPFLAYYGVRCLLWESSTFFLNIHWFLDKTGHTGSTFQFVNGLCLLIAFFGIRIVYGGLMSYDFFHTLYDVRDEVSPLYLFVYGVGNVALQGLNWLWFAKMIIALRKRFSADSRTKRKSNQSQ